MGSCFGLGPDFDFTIDEEEPEHGEDCVEAHETDEREPGVAGSDAGRKAVSGAHDAVDEPGLAAEFGREPAGSVSDVWERNAKHEDPEHPAGFEEFFAPEEKG